MPVKKVIKKTKKTSKVVKKPVKKIKTKKKPAPKKKPAKKVVKKTARKTSTKKKPVKKSIKKKTSKKPALIISSNEESFWVNNGPVLNSLLALKDALSIITVEQFEFHTKGFQNDFAIWVETVLLDTDCAKELKKAKTQKTAIKKIDSALKKYKK